MTWVLIVLVLVIAFGPVLWLVPSKRDRRLAALRAAARSEGLLVEMRRLPKPDPRPEERVSAGGRIREPVQEYAAYGRMLAKKLRYLPAWRLIRHPAEGGPDPFPAWQFDQRPKGEARTHLEPMLQLAAKMLEQLPEDAAALEVDTGSVFVYWREKPGSTPETVARLAGAIRAFEADLAALDGRSAPGTEDADS